MVVLVAVGDDAPFDAVGVLAEPREVGKHEIDAEHVGIREHQPAVEQHDAPGQFDRGAVPAYLTEPSEERDTD